MSKDHTWEYQSTVANIAMQYFGMRNAINIIVNELTDKYYIRTAVNMAKSKYLHSKNHHNFLKGYWITKEMDTRDILYKRYDNIIVCLLSHLWEAISTKILIREKDPMYFE
jgi:Mg2+/Co2+ transporter CorB